MAPDPSRLSGAQFRELESRYARALERQRCEVRFDGFVCIDRTGRSFGFLVFREEPGAPVVLECSTWAWPATDDGRAAARQQMVRVIQRLQAESAHASMRALAA